MERSEGQFQGARKRQLHATFDEEMKPDRTTRNWHKAIIADAERIVGRTLTNSETNFITSRGGFIALEMIHDTIRAGTKEEIVRYLNSEAAKRNDMSVSVILAHPKIGSFSHAIASRCVAVLEASGHKVNYHDLYAERFDGVLPFGELPRDVTLPSDIERHCSEISTASGIVIVHPNWWGQPPAILKGWVDRVIRPGVAYEFIEGDQGEGVPRGLLNARSVTVFNTSNTDAERERAVFGDPLELIWKNCIFYLCGVSDVYRRTFSIVVTSTETERQTWLAEVSRIITERHPNT